MQHNKSRSKNTERKNDGKKSQFRSAIQIYNRLIHDKTLYINLNNVRMGYGNIKEKCILDWVITNKGGDTPMKFRTISKMLFCGYCLNLIVTSSVMSFISC